MPKYAIFEPIAGSLEVYQLDSDRYLLQQPEANNRYWISEIDLFLGVWHGTKGQRTGYWLRWWDQSGQMLLWGEELVAQERRLRERMAAKLREMGINPEDV